MNNKEKGDLGERLAREYLIKEKFSILKSNYRCKIGEIDLIASKENQLIFIEVKSRSSLNYGYPSESVNYKKQIKIINVAKQYILENKLYNYNCRFDVIEVYFKNNRINHIENAFWGR